MFFLLATSSMPLAIAWVLSQPYLIPGVFILRGPATVFSPGVVSDHIQVYAHRIKNRLRTAS